MQTLARLVACTLGAVLLVDSHPSTTTEEPPSGPLCASGCRPGVGGTSTLAAFGTARPAVTFEPNVGQFEDASIRFVARRGRAALALRDDGSTLVVHAPDAHGTKGPVPEEPGRAVVLGFKVDGGRTVVPEASDELVTKTHYFVGERERWRTNVATYGKVVYRSVLDGIDLVYHGDGGAFEYDFVVAPGADVGSIAMNVTGGDDVELAEDGALRVHTAAGDLVQPVPVVYQRDDAGNKRVVSAKYRLVGRNKVGFEVAAYDRERPLVIDPIFSFSTFLGGAWSDDVFAVAIDAEGNTYAGGITSEGVGPDAPSSFESGFVAKFDPAGAFLSATYLSSYVSAIAVRPDGIYLTGAADERLPVVNALQPTYGGDISDAFVTRLSPAGDELLYSTYLGGPGWDEGTAIAVDSTGIYVTGHTKSAEFLGAGPAIDWATFVVKLSPDGQTVDWVDFLDAEGAELGKGLVLDGAGHAYIAGNVYGGGDAPLVATSADAPFVPCSNPPGGYKVFIARTNLLEDGTSDGFDIVKCIGGSTHRSSVERSNSLAIDASGNLYIGGFTHEPDFPKINTTSDFPEPPNGGARGGFVVKLTPGASDIAWTQFPSGSMGSMVWGLTVDPANTVWVTGETESSDFPTLPTMPYVGAGGASRSDAFVTRFDESGALVFSALFGGPDNRDYGFSIAARGSRIRIGGTTYSVDFPVVNASHPQHTGDTSSDGFLVGFSTEPLLLSPQSATRSAGESQQFTAVGGMGSYTFSLQSNNSGGSITPAGLYTAGAAAGVDVVAVTDEAGQRATANVAVSVLAGTLVIIPGSASVTPRGSRTFTATGGIAPYTFALASNASGATIGGSGTYVAGARGNVTDVIRVTDGSGQRAQATVTVGPGVSITPSSPSTSPQGGIAFTATGGSGSGFVWTLAKNGSSATIDAATGAYKAGVGSSTVDTVKVTDSLGNTAQVNVSVGGGVAISPAAATVATRGTVAFSAVGGAGSYTWTLTSAPSGGSISPTTGVYTAGTNGNTKDTVRVQDAVGNASTADVSIGPGLTLTPEDANVVAGATVVFSAAGGSGAGYTFAIEPNASGGSIGADGVYTAGPNGGDDVVRLTDSLGNVDTTTVHVTAIPASPSPNDPGASSPSGGSEPGGSGDGGANDSGCSLSTGPVRGRGVAAVVLGLALALARRRRERR